MLEAINNARRTEEFDLWAYVIMPEHVHVLISPRSPAYDISKILWRLKRPVARQAFAYLQAHSPGWLTKLSLTRDDGTNERRFWQRGGGYDRNLVDERTVRHVIDYFHLNPVRRGLVVRPEDWEWSSARWYAGHRPVHLEIDPTLPIVSET